MAPSAARARGSGADHKPTWQLFAPAWHTPLWSDRALSFLVPSMSAATHSWTSTLLSVGTHQCLRLAFQKVSPLTNGIYWEGISFLRTPFTEGCAAVNYQTLPPRRSNKLYFQFSSVQFGVWCYQRFTEKQWGCSHFELELFATPAPPALGV